MAANERREDSGPVSAAPDPSNAPPSTRAPSSFHQRIIQLGRVHCAVDYALANCSLVEVEGGAVLIDTGPSVSAAEEIKAEFAKRYRGELKGIIYTHSHPDHIRGAVVFHRPGLPIWAHERFHEEIREQNKLAQAYLVRGAKQFGYGLDPALVTTNGIGPPLRFDPGAVPPIIPPTQTFADTLDLEIGGVRFHLRWAPGETHDHLFVWLPQDRILLAGDNLYRSFPNLYAIRGVPPRPVEGWIRSLDQMRALSPAPEHLVLGHTEPVSGAGVIQQLLTDYRDAIAFVHDSVVRMINAGQTPDEMVRAIRLPKHLEGHPYLAETYGTLAASIRGIYSGYLGWFDGNATNLDPLDMCDLRERLLPWLGGQAEVGAKIEQALALGDARWAVWLADLLLAGEGDGTAARQYKAQALSQLAQTTGNPLYCHWYLSEALALGGVWKPPRKLPVDLRTVEAMPIEEILRLLPQRVRPDRAARRFLTVGLEFHDSGKQFTFIIRRGVGEVRTGLPQRPDLTMRTTEQDFKRAFVARTLRPRSREFWRRIKIEAPGGWLPAPLRKLLRLWQLGNSLIRT